MMAGGRGAGAYLPPLIWLKINGERREGRRSPQGAFVSRYGAQTGLVVRFMFHSRHHSTINMNRYNGQITPIESSWR